MLHIIPQPASIGTPVDVRAIAHVLANTEPDLWAPVLPGESWADLIARREARADILDELLVTVGGTGCTFCGGDGTDGAGHPCLVCKGTGGR
jgi:hypothetical protein